MAEAQPDGFEDRQRARRAAGRIGTAALLARVAATSPHLVAYAERLLATPVPDTIRSGDAVGGMREMRDAIGAVRMLNARREITALIDVLADEPTSPLAPAWRERLTALTGYVRDLERSGVVRPRPWAALLEREGRRP